MDIKFYDNDGYCSIEFESDLDNEKSLLREIYLKLINKPDNEKIIWLNRVLYK